MTLLALHRIHMLASFSCPILLEAQDLAHEFGEATGFIIYEFEKNGTQNRYLRLVESKERYRDTESDKIFVSNRGLSLSLKRDYNFVLFVVYKKEILCDICHLERQYLNG
jgi:hypothetical protein